MQLELTFGGLFISTRLTVHICLNNWVWVNTCVNQSLDPVPASLRIKNNIEETEVKDWYYKVLGVHVQAHGDAAVASIG